MYYTLVFSSGTKRPINVEFRKTPDLAKIWSSEKVIATAVIFVEKKSIASAAQIIATRAAASGQLMEGIIGKVDKFLRNLSNSGAGGKVENVRFSPPDETKKPTYNIEKLCIARHFDDIGHGHIALVVDRIDENCYVLFLSSNPYWSTRYRECSEYESDVFSNLITGAVRTPKKKTYICKVKDPVHVRDLVLVNSVIPQCITDKLVSEFYPSSVW